MQKNSMEHPAMWRFTNPAVKIELGYPTSFEIMPQGVGWGFAAGIGPLASENGPGSQDQSAMG